MERQHQNNHRNNNNNNTNQNGDSNSIQTVFETVTTMVQNSSPPLALPDELKLSLYGLYKRSTIGTTTMNEYEYPPPSRWNIVANRKYQAWVECNGLNEHESMIGYVELVAGLDCDLGRECQVILLEILEEKEQQQQQQLRGEEYHQLESKTSSHHLEDDNGVEDETVATSTTTAATIKTTTSNSKSLQSFRKKRSATLNTPKVTSQSSFMTKMTGIQPFTPRGQIDISTMDIVSTFVSTIPSCISSISSSVWNKNNYCHHNNMHKTVQLEIDIATSWKEQHITMNGNNNDNNTHISSSSSESSMIMMNHVITGLSVRTLLDLYLSSKSFPKDSEVIIVPPISIEGMIDVIQYHDINIVPIDIDDYKKDIGNNEGASTPIIHVNLDRVRSAITSKTIAVMIVHPFGLVCMDDNDMKELKVMLQEESLRHDRRNDDNAIEIWEDCAECYTGGNSSDSLHGYSGSSYANLQLYSFGVIKTATSLGGGIAILKQQKNIADKMKRLQHMTYEEQKTTDYFVKVCKVLVLHFLSRNVIVLSLLVQFLDVLGLDYDHLVTSSVRGFPVATEKEKSHRLNRRSKELIIEQRKDRARLLVERLRKRPCPALLSLLHKRILQSSQTLKTVQTRIHRCESMKVLLQRKKMSLKIPKGLNSSIHLHWLFPIVVDNPELFTSYMKKRGYDVPRGASQLGCVNTFLFDTDSAQSCPNTEWMMNHIVYLSIASIPMKKERIENFTQALDKATVNIEPNMKGRSRHFTKLKCYIIVCVCIDGYITRFIPFSSTCYSTIRWLFVTFTYCALPVMVGIFILLHIARSTMGKYYLKCSSAFAKYNTIFGEKSTFKNAVSVSNEMLNESGLVVLGSAEKFQQSTDLFESSSLALPNRENLPDSARQSENMVLLTGSTGFIGSLLLRELLLHREKLHINGVIVICRSKRNMSAEERMDDLMKKPMFSFLTENEKMKLVVVMEGDVASTNIGMKEADLQRLKCEFDVSHVFNCAACVNFTETLENAAESNITSALQIQQLIKKLKNKNATYTYLSTAFIHGNQLGSSEKPLTEDLFDFGKYDPVELYKSMMTTQSCASKAMNELGFPNTYTFSKSVCEHLLMYEKDVKTIIVRPSIVGPSIQEPYEGWAGDKPSTLVAGACLYMNNPYNLWSFRRERASVIPVDVVCRFVLSKAFRDEVIPLCKSDEDSSKLSDESCRSSESSYVITKSSTVNSYSSESGSSLSFIEDKVDKQIFTAAWDTKSPSKTGFLWYEFACAIVQLSTVHGHVEMSIAYFVLLVSFRIFLAMNLTFDSFQKVHRILVHGPFCIITHIYHLIGTQPKLLNIFEKLRPFLDLPLLFFPFTTSTFHFTSELIAPSSLNGERYMFACILAAENFVNAMKQKMSKDSNNQKRKQEYNYTNYLIAGKEHTNLSSDAWWALAQPNGSYIIRFIGMIIRKMLRLSTTAVTIDMDTMTKVTRAIDESTDDIKPYLVLAPTHRSFYDFIILSYITFALPECGIPVPYIVAADDFSRLPLLGWIAQLAGAFFVSRGKGIPDPKLKAKVASLKKNDTYDSPSCIEVFLEGRRSRDRRFLQPKTGFLR
jgi:glycerone phosphate O-acyltransferase